MTIGYDKLSPLCDQVKHLILGDLKIGHDRSRPVSHPKQICANAME